MTASQEERGGIAPAGQAAPPRMEQGCAVERGGRGTTSLMPCRGLHPGKGEEPHTDGRCGEDLVGQDVPNASQHTKMQIIEPFQKSFLIFLLFFFFSFAVGRFTVTSMSHCWI